MARFDNGYIHVDSYEAAIAYDRWRTVHGIDRTFLDFLLWLGFSPNVNFNEDAVGQRMGLQIGKGVVGYDKLVNLLSPHWYALLKAARAHEQ